jgi:hypothetical protein
MSLKLEPLDPEVADLLRDDRAAYDRASEQDAADDDGEDVPAGARRSVLNRVELSIAGMAARTPDAPGASDTSPSERAAERVDATSHFFSPLAQRIVIGVASLAIGAGAGAMAMRSYDATHAIPAPRAATVSTESPTTPVVANSPVPPASPTVMLVPSATAAALPSRPSTLANAAPSMMPTTGGAPFSDDDATSERLLLDEARGALMRGESPKAVAPLLDHARRYPRGRLAEEREALLVQALARSGRSAEAQERGARFERQYPGSLLLPAVQDALASIGDH